MREIHLTHLNSDGLNCFRYTQTHTTAVENEMNDFHTIILFVTWKTNFHSLATYFNAILCVLVLNIFSIFILCICEKERVSLVDEPYFMTQWCRMKPKTEKSKLKSEMKNFVRSDIEQCAPFWLLWSDRFDFPHMNDGSGFFTVIDLKINKIEAMEIFGSNTRLIKIVWLFFFSIIFNGTKS